MSTQMGFHSSRSFRFGAVLAILVPAIFALGPAAGCNSAPCTPAAQIDPGVGVLVADKAVCLGDSMDNIEGALGKGAVRWDMGRLGMRVSYPDHHLTLLYSGCNAGDTLVAIYLQGGATGKTKGGVGIGSAEAAVKAELGEPTIDPFLKARIYRKLGIAVQLEGGKVSRVQVRKRQGGG